MIPPPVQVDRKMFDGEVSLTPPATVEEALTRLPARRGLALLLAEGDRPVLLLPAADLRARVTGRMKNPDEQERRRLPDLQAITRTILWRLATSHFESDLRFLEIARRLWPDAYEEMLAWKPAWFIRVDLSADYPYFSRTQDVRGEGFQRGEGILPSRPEGVPPSIASSSSSSSVNHSHEAAESNPGTGETPVRLMAETAMPRLRCFGPFPGGSAAQRFIDGLADAFNLCRDVRCLRQSPRGRRCSYGQMGKCLCPCDGTIPAADYARVVAEAAEFVGELRPGARPAPEGVSPPQPLAQRLRQEMKQAAGGLQFERAAALRARLGRLEELRGPDYAYVAPLEEFRFLLVQKGEGRRQKKLSAFLADCEAIRSAGPLEYPLKAEQIAALVGKLGTPPYFRDGNRVASVISDGNRAPSPIPNSEIPRATSCTPYAGSDRWAMGLVAHYLFAGPRRRGVILPAGANLTADAVAAEIEKSAEMLGLKKGSQRTGG